jgi:hypothetical protein
MSQVNRPGPDAAQWRAHGQFLSSTFLSLRDRSGLTVFAFIWNVPPAFANPGREYQFAKVKFATRSSALQKGPDEPVPVARPLAAHVKFNVRIVFPSHKFYDLSRALLCARDWKSERATFMVNSSISLPHAFIN